MFLRFRTSLYCYTDKHAGFEQTKWEKWEKVNHGHMWPPVKHGPIFGLIFRLQIRTTVPRAGVWAARTEMMKFQSQVHQI